MYLSVYNHCICAFLRRCRSISFFAILALMSMFQGHVACWNFSLTEFFTKKSNACYLLKALVKCFFFFLSIKQQQKFLRAEDSVN